MNSICIALATLAAMGITSVCPAQTYTVLKNLTGSTGANPMSGLVLSGSTLYGTAFAGGISNNGTAFKLNTDGSGFTVLHYFHVVPDGENPWGLTLSGSTLYGTTDAAYYDDGTIYKIGTSGAGYTKIYQGSDPYGVAAPIGSPLLSNGVFYGASHGGARDDGAVFKMNVDGSGVTDLYDFLLVAGDGEYPNGDLALSGSTLYGTTQGGGSLENGTLFQINTDGTGYAKLYEFAGPPDGSEPQAGLVLSGGTLYGTTYQGGLTNGGALRGYGTVFKINTDGSGYSVLYSFSGQPDGSHPQACLLLAGNTLYGTTYSGGISNNGTIFQINTDGTGYAVLKSFLGYDGANPEAGVVLAGGTLYGTTYGGGSSNLGSVFSLSLPPPLSIQALAGQVILSWRDPSLDLQSASEVDGTYTNVPGATSPYTNAITGDRQFFRLGNGF